MSTGMSSHSCSQADLLHGACARRLATDVYLETMDGERLRGRTRLLGYDDHTVFIERPTQDGMPLERTSILTATIHFILDGERYAVRCHVDRECQIPIGDGVVVPGFALLVCQPVSRSERRHDCRASVDRDIEIHGTVQPCDSPGRQFTGWVMNVSAGGMALISPEVTATRLRLGGTYELEFDLPKIKKHFRFRAELRHVRDLAGAGCVLGFKYLPQPDCTQMRHDIRQISQFVAKQLNRKKQRRSSQ